MRKQFTQQLLLKLKKLRKPDHSRIKFYNMWPFKSQVLIYFDRETTKSLFASFSMFSNFCPRNKLNCLSSLFYFASHIVTGMVVKTIFVRNKHIWWTSRCHYCPTFMNTQLARRCFLHTRSASVLFSINPISWIQSWHKVLVTRC